VSESGRRARVAIVRAGEYDPSLLSAAIAKAVRLTGGLETVIKPGARVFVKINHLPPPSPPERGIVTHPVFTEAVISLLKAAGAHVIVGDEIETGAADGFLASGYREMCRRAGVRLVNLREEGFAATGCNGRLLSEVYLSRIASEADVIINLPKLKTHSLTVLTGGVKNMYGIIPVSERRRLHGEYPDSDAFSQMLVDVFAGAPPHLTIMDGVVAMEGEGPAGGSTRRLGVILASRDTVAVDATAAAIIGIDPQDIGTTRHAHQRGLGTGSLDSIEVLGESLSSVAVSDFRMPASASRRFLRRVPAPLTRFTIRQLSVRPRVVEHACAACGECVRACPTGAIAINDGTAAIDRALCIGCMCCHEVCRYDAVTTERTPVGHVVERLSGWLRALSR